VGDVLPDPVRLKSPVVRPVLRIGQLRGGPAAAAYFSADGAGGACLFWIVAETMRSDVFECFLENSGGATRFRDADSDGPFAVQPAAHNRFALHAISFCAASRKPKVERHYWKAKGQLETSRHQAGRALSEGSPGLASEMNVEAVDGATAERYSNLEFWNMPPGDRVNCSQLVAATNQLAKDRESSYEDLLGDFYGSAFPICWK